MSWDSKDSPLSRSGWGLVKQSDSTQKRNEELRSRQWLAIYNLDLSAIHFFSGIHKGEEYDRHTAPFNNTDAIRLTGRANTVTWFHSNGCECLVDPDRIKSLTEEEEVKKEFELGEENVGRLYDLARITIRPSVRSAVEGSIKLSLIWGDFEIFTPVEKFNELKDALMSQVMIPSEMYIHFDSFDDKPLFADKERECKAKVTAYDISFRSKGKD